MRNLVMFALVGFFAMVAMVAGSGELLAQTTPEPVVFTEMVSWGTIFDTLRTAIAPLAAAALGLGLAIWAARYVFGVIKGMGR